jgi:hypothetical protein
LVGLRGIKNGIILNLDFVVEFLRDILLGKEL